MKTWTTWRSPYDRAEEWPLVANQSALDEGAVYATGMSNGGQISLGPGVPSL